MWVALLLETIVQKVIQTLIRPIYTCGFCMISTRKVEYVRDVFCIRSLSLVMVREKRITQGIALGPLNAGFVQSKD